MAEGEGTGGDGGSGGGAGTGGGERSFTQEELNAIVAQEKRALTAKFSEEKDGLAGQLESLKKEHEPLKAVAAQSAEKVKELEASLGQETTKAMRYKVAVEKGLPLAIAERLTGDTEEALKTDADSLSELLKKPGGGGLAGGPRNEAPPEKPSINDMIRKAAGRGTA
jgi:hypothetical protein